MAHESFESEETAKIMNENFVNIKVDREERPDIDKIVSFLFCAHSHSTWYSFCPFFGDFRHTCRPFLGEGDGP